jgi:molybdate transport system ATP-binding protein
VTTPTTFSARVSLDLDRFRLDVALETKAHVTGLFGPSGCGKTSFLESVAGLRRGALGRVQLGETRWQDTDQKLFLAPERRGVGYVPQSGLLFPHRNVRQNLESGLRRAFRIGHDNERTWKNVIELLELGPLLDRRVGTLSGGETQRVALGRALCSAPKLMLLDEPLAGLDQPLRRKILPFLRRVREEFNVPMILVSHDPIEVQALCDDLVVLRQGTVVARGAPREVLLNPAVFPMANERGFENIIPGTIIVPSHSGTRVRLGSPETELTLQLAVSAPGTTRPCLVGVPARDVLIAVQEPAGLSARNVLPAVVEEVHSVGSFELVKVRLDPELPSLAVEVTRAAVEQLSLAPGKHVFVVIKAMSCTLYDETA